MHQSPSLKRILGWTASWQLKGLTTPQCYRCDTVCKERGQGTCSEKKAAFCSEPTQLSLAESGSVTFSVCEHLTTHPEQTHTHKCNSNAEVRQDDHCPSGMCCIMTTWRGQPHWKKKAEGVTAPGQTLFFPLLHLAKKNTSESITSVHL